MTIKTLHNQSGITISELITFLQKSQDQDGKVFVAIDSSAKTGVEQVMLFDSNDVLLLAKTDNPCIDIYSKAEREPRYLCAETVEAIERMRK